MYKVFSGDETLLVKESDWAQFCANYTVIEAGGGIVENEEGAVLMILRRNKWDLPKGKRELGETIEECALREVREECGLATLVIQHKVGVTYHIYTDQWHQDPVLKASHWFAMQGTLRDPLLAQAEEDIARCEWVPRQAVIPMLSNTFASIKEILILFFDKTPLA